MTGSPAPTVKWFRNGVTFNGWTGTTLSLPGVSSNDVGNYTAVATNSLGSATSNPAILSVTAPSSSTPATNAPVITLQPVGITVGPFSVATFLVAASGSPAPTIKWFRNGVTFPGWTGTMLIVAGISSNDAGVYTAVATNSAGSATSVGAVLTVNSLLGASSVSSTPPTAAYATAATSRLANLSVRSDAGSGEDSLIVGFVVEGSSPASLLIRGSGPALASFGVPGTLADPTLALYSGSSLLAANDDWSASADAAAITPASERAGAFTLPAASHDAALLAQLPAGAYTGQVSGKDSATGAALIELYNADENSAARLVNVSVRTAVKSAGEAPVIGFVVTGTTAKTLLIRAVGPSLSTFGVSGVLADPQLELYSGSARLEHNDNWSGSPELAAAFARVGAFALAEGESKDAVLLVSVPPGAYTAVVGGADQSTGTVLVEVYEVQ